MHIDANNAFLSWTAIYLLINGHNEDIRNTYAVIGGDESKRSGIVLAKSMLAKKCGVVTGETLYSARKKCPNLNVYPSNYKWYQKMSSQMFILLKKYTPDIEIFSIDECFLDYTKVKNLYGDEIIFANKISKEIKEQLGFTVNIGIGNNKLCAKMASDFSKPDKIHTLYHYEVKDKMYKLPVGDLFGVGKKTAIKLNELGVKTIGDLANYDSNRLYKFFKNQSIKMIDLARGIDNSEVISKISDPKGISNEITLEHNVIDKKEIYSYLFSLSELVGVRLRNQNKYASVIAVILKDKYFKRKSHQKKLINPTNITSEIYEMSKKIYDEMENDDPIRLIGLRLDNLTENIIHQVSLFEDLELRDKSNQLDKVLDNLKSKYGTKVIKKASLLNSKCNDRFQ